MRIYITRRYYGVIVYAVVWDLGGGQMATIDLFDLLGGEVDFQFYPLDDLDPTG
jgi:hypothetical protein